MYSKYTFNDPVAHTYSTPVVPINPVDRKDNESLNEDIAMDSGSSTKTEDGPNALSESNCQKGKCIVAVAQVMLPGDATSIVADCLADPLKP